MDTLSWLHLTDLHHGLINQSFLWPQIEQLFFQDLDRLHGRVGPFDLLLFTGDLTQRGTPEEFARLDLTLGRLYQRLRRLGSDPVFLAVPGNHDLVRPNPRDPAVKLLLDRFEDDQDLRHEFFTDPASRYRQVVDTAFAPYAAWWQHHPYPRPAQLQPGLLPGEFAAVLHKGEHQLGVVGLNTAFLQLSGADFLGRLFLHPQQLHQPCDGDGPSWTAARPSLLLTHHPPSWLSPTARRDLHAEIAPPGRFVAHLFGHMHEATAHTHSEGGALPTRQIQGCSLFGLERFGEQDEQRSHGYAVGRLEIGAGETRLRLWPRRSVRDARGSFRLVPDYQGFDLEDDHGTRPEVFQSAPQGAPASARSSARLGSAPPPAPPHPREPYSRSWYVQRPKEERIALSLLQAPGAPVLLWGPSGCGKTWLYQHLLHRTTEEGGGGQVLSLDLHSFPPAARVSLDAFAREFAAQLARAVGAPADTVDRVWSYGTPGTKLGRTMEQIIRSAPGTLHGQRVILGIDRADALFGLPFEDDFFGFLRAWADDQDEPWLHLRLLLAVSITPALLIHKRTHSPLLNRVVPIRLPDFEPEQVGLLLERAGLLRSKRDVPALMALVGGHPYLVGLAAHGAHRHGLALRELAHDAEVAERVFAEHLQELRTWLREQPALLAALGQVRTQPRQPLDPAVYEQLHRAGCLDMSETEGYRIARRLYQDFLRDG